MTAPPEDDDDAGVVDAYNRRITRWVVQRLTDSRVLEELEPLIELIARQAVKTTLQVVEDDGFCSFDFHESIAEAMPDGITCDSCGLLLADHERVPVCNYSDDKHEMAVDRIRHRREERARRPARRKLKAHDETAAPDEALPPCDPDEES